MTSRQRARRWIPALCAGLERPLPAEGQNSAASNRVLLTCRRWRQRHNNRRKQLLSVGLGLQRFRCEELEDQRRAREPNQQPRRPWPGARRPKHLDTPGSADTWSLFTLLLVGKATQQEVMEEGGADQSEGPTAAGAGHVSPRTQDHFTHPL